MLETEKRVPPSKCHPKMNDFGSQLFQQLASLNCPDNVMVISLLKKAPNFGSQQQKWVPTTISSITDTGRERGAPTKLRINQPLD